MEDSTKNYYLKAPDLVGTKDVTVYDGDKEIQVTVENSKVTKVDAGEAGADYDIDEINSQLQSGAHLGEALTGGLNVIRENTQSRLGYVVKLKNGKYISFPFSKYGDGEAQTMALEKAREVSGQVYDIISTNGKVQPGELIWPEDLQESKLKSLIRECIREVISELR